MEISQKLFFRAQFIRVASRPSESQAARKAADLIAPEEELPETEPLALPACGHVSRRSLLRLHTCGFIATSIPSPHQSRDLSTMSETVRFLAGTLLLTTLCGSAVAQTTSQAYAAQRQAAANRHRSVNGV
ncbi:MAG TPA: hypothetical protein VER57_01400, partial [Cyanobium sp.]|nr:hypothetical protein [Cyanobium sp.]